MLAARIASGGQTPIRGTERLEVPVSSESSGGMGPRVPTSTRPTPDGVGSAGWGVELVGCQLGDCFYTGPGVDGQDA